MCSHLLLSPESKVGQMVKSSRGNYDIAVVYAWGKPLTSLYHENVGKAVVEAEPVSGNKSTRSRNAKARKLPIPKYKLNTYDLLHIRNFWHRHFNEVSQGFPTADIAEGTYSGMAKALARAGLAPREWDKPLQYGNIQIQTEWYGHYSTLSQWPKKRLELEEVQSLASDWSKVDPLVS